MSQVELRGAGGEQPGARPGGEERPEADDGSAGPRLRCATCGRRIASASALFSTGGAAGPSVYVNPHGLVFEILTVRDAQGLVAVGGATAEHTWFPGYAWQVVCCSSCGTHLGWRFTSSSAEPPVFYGLIRSALRESE